MQHEIQFGGEWTRTGVVLTLATMLLAVAAGGAPAWALSYYLAIDVPALLGGTNYSTNQVVRSDNAIYVLETTLPAGAELAGLHRRTDGVWLFAASHPTNLGAIEFEPRDLVSYDGVSFATFLDGSAIGIPEFARIDSVFLDSAGKAVLSFDVPVNLGATEYSRSDLVRHEGGGVFTLFWDAEAAGLPAYSNVVGAAEDSVGSLVISLDVPTNIGGTEFLPGQLVQWTGSGFVNHFLDASWSPSAQLRDFAFVPAAGAVPDGEGVPGTPLMVSAAGGNLTLSWGASCLASDTDYAIYEGILGAYYSHTMKFCSAGGATTFTFPQPSGSTYYLVVPRNGVSEGSYGRRSNGSERPTGGSACLPQEIAIVCP